LGHWEPRTALSGARGSRCSKKIVHLLLLDGKPTSRPVREQQEVPPALTLTQLVSSKPVLVPHLNVDLRPALHALGGIVHV
jgi:hypothetical protein